MRVEFSKNMLTIVFPWSGGTFLIGRSRTSRKETAVSRISWMSSRRIPSKPEEVSALKRHETLISLSLRADSSGCISRTASSPSTSFTWTRIDSVGRGRDILPDVVGPDRELPVAAVDEDGELDRLRAAEVDQLVERGADRPPV